MIPAELKIDIYLEAKKNFPNAQFFIIDRSIDELNNLINSNKGKIKRNAELSLKILKEQQAVKINKLITKKYKGNVDDIILHVSKKHNFAVATQDKELKKRFKKNNLKIIILRQKKYLRLIE